jgi:drug/metabolite transporter (DMT)-like permease
MGVAPLATATGQVTASSLVMIPLALAIDRPWTPMTPSPAAIAALLGVAAPSTALAYVLDFRILATAGATNLLLVTFRIPVTASCRESSSPGRLSRSATSSGWP